MPSVNHHRVSSINIAKMISDHRLTSHRRPSFVVGFLFLFMNRKLKKRDLFSSVNIKVSSKLTYIRALHAFLE